MVNYAVYYGASQGYEGYKLLITKHIPKEWNLFVATRDLEKLDLGRGGNITRLYQNPVFGRSFSDEEIAREERWLGHPFRLILEYNYNWERQPPARLREYYEILAKFVVAWRDFFQENGINYFTSTQEAGYLESVGQLVSRRLGIPNALIKRGTMTDTYYLLDWDFMPLRWKKIGKNEYAEIYEKVSEYYEKKASPVNKYHAKARAKGHDLTASNIPNKIATLFSYANRRRSLPWLEKMRILPPGKMLRNFALKFIRRRLGPLHYDKPKPEDRFFLFTLSYPKEAKNSYVEWPNNPFELISKISKALPYGHFLYVKPHFIYGCEEVPLSEISKMKALGNVKLVSHELNVFDLLRKSAGLIHVSSTTGIEAAALGKPVITFGHYNFAKPGVSIVIRDMKDLPEAVIGVLRNPEWGIDPEERRKAFVEEYAHLIPVEGKSFHHQITDKDGKKIAEAIVDYARSSKIS